MSAGAEVESHDSTASTSQPALWPIERNHGMHKGPGYLGDAPHTLRTRELFKYYQPPAEGDFYVVAPLNTGEDFITEYPNLAPNLKSSHDPILACFANLTCRILDAKRCIVTMTGVGLSYVIAESTRSLSLRHPHTHEPGDQLMLGGGSATASMDGLCEHTISLVPPPIDSNEPFMLEIPDLQRHPKYAGTGYVRGWPFGRFYAGAPLRTKNGVSIGTVCILDDKPRYEGLTPHERVQLQSMADIFMSYLETKQGDSDVRKAQMMEMELSRFIAEGFLPEEGAAMVERRDGRLWSEKILEDRRQQEMERKKKVEERRQVIQEQQFAEMLKRETVKLRIQHREEDGGVTEAEDETRKLGEVKAAAAREGLTVPREGTQSPSPSVNSFKTAAEDDNEVDETAIVVAKTRPQQPGIIQTAAALPITVDLSVIDELAQSTPTPLKDLLPATTRPHPGPHRGDRSSSDETMSTSSTAWSESLIGSAGSCSNTDYSSVDLGSSDPSVAYDYPGTFSETSSRKRRRSKYEQTTSVEPHYRAMFSRAAGLIRNALDANVVFVDGDLEGFFGPGADAVDLNASSPDVMDAVEWSASHVSSDPNIEAEARARRPKSHRRRSGILGYATGGGTSSAARAKAGLDSVEELGFDVSELSEDILTQLAEESVGGQIITHIDQYPGLEEEDRPQPSLTERKLQKFLPGNRSVIIVPLFDHNRKIFAVGFAWTCSSTRVFTGDVEGRFVTGVANSIMGEVTRLNILNADKAKGEFISSISHELRSPLHGILASAEFLAESKLGHDQRPFLDTIVSCGTTLLDTVNHVLDFQKLNVLPDQTTTTTDAEEPERTVLETIKEEVGSECSDSSSVLVGTILSETDMSRLVQDVTEGVCLGYGFQGFSHFPISGSTTTGASSPQSGKNVTVIVDIDPRSDGWCFLANSAAFKRIINNLVGNAFKYNKENGWIRVHLSAIEAKEKHGQKRSLVKLTVSDSGKGISREFLKTKLFTPFTQENPLSSGAGLGMSIVRRVVGLMGGKIDVQSQVGIGTQVTVETVLVHTNPSEADQVEFAGRGQLKKARLLGLDHYNAPVTNIDVSRRAASILRDSLTLYAKEYFDLEILDDSSTEQPDTIFVNELTTENQSALQQLCKALPSAAVLVLCQRIPPDRPVLFPPHTPIATAFLQKPCGPRKISRALDLCLTELSDLKKHPRASQSHERPTFRIPLPSPAIPSQIDPDSAIEITSPARDKPRFTTSITNTTTSAIFAVSTPIKPLTSTTDDFFSISHPTSSPAVAEVMENKTTITKRLPAFPSPKGTEAKDAKDNGKPRVLAVEDNHINMMLLTTHLKKNGFSFNKAVDGMEALEEVRNSSHAYDVILMDLQMPVLSGIESTREIRKLERANPAAKRAYIVALTGLAAENDRRDAFEAGVDAFMVKPVNFKVLQGMINEEWRKRGEGGAQPVSSEPPP